MYALVACLLWIIQRLPPIVCDFVGQAAGFAAWMLLPRYRRLVQRNLTIAFGMQKNQSAIRSMTAAHFRRLGANLMGAARFFASTEKLVRAHTTIENLELLRDAHARGRGVILAISHIGNWEMFAQACFYAREMPFGTVFQKVHNKFVDDAITRFRRRLGVRTFDRKTELNAAAGFLRSGGVLGVLVDQHAGPSGIWTPFFGRLASTSPLAASLAVRTGAAVVPVAIFRSGPARWRIAIRPEVAFPEDSSVEEVTCAINRVLESQITESPLDWFWVHSRWKLPHPEFLLAKAKRGIYLPADFSSGSLQKLRLVIRSSNWLGDAVMNVPAVRAIKAGRPDLHLAVLCPAKLADLWRAVPEVDEVLPMPRKGGLWQTAGLLKAGRFEAGIVFPNSLRTALEMWLAGVPRRAGFAGHRRRWLLNQIVPPRKGRMARMRPQHHARHYLLIAERLGAVEVPPVTAPRGEPGTEPTTGMEGEKSPALTSEGRARNCIGVCPGAEYGPAKRWPIESFRAVMEAVSARRDCVWRIFGVEKDRPLAANLVKDFAGTVLDRTGRTNLAELIAELRTCRLLLTNDTGTMHLAAMLGVPVVAVFGSTEPLLTGPIGARVLVLRRQVECSPCFLRECPLDFRCMKELRPEQATEAVLQMLESPQALTP